MAMQLMDERPEAYADLSLTAPMPMEEIDTFFSMPQVHRGWEAATSHPFGHSAPQISHGDSYPQHFQGPEHAPFMYGCPPRSHPAWNARPAVVGDVESSNSRDSILYSDDQDCSDVDAQGEAWATPATPSQGQESAGCNKAEAWEEFYLKSPGAGDGHSTSLVSHDDGGISFGCNGPAGNKGGSYGSISPPAAGEASESLDGTVTDSPETRGTGELSCLDGTSSERHYEAGETSHSQRRQQQPEQHTPYAQYIHRALMEKEDHCMSLQELYSWFQKNTSKCKPGERGWMNSIRHNLSMNAGFKKKGAPESAEGAGDGPTNAETTRTTSWALTEEAIANGIQSTTRYRNKKSNGGGGVGGVGVSLSVSRNGSGSGSGTRRQDVRISRPLASANNASPSSSSSLSSSSSSTAAITTSMYGNGTCSRFGSTRVSKADGKATRRGHTAAVQTPLSLPLTIPGHHLHHPVAGIPTTQGQYCGQVYYDGGGHDSQGYHPSMHPDAPAAAAAAGSPSAFQKEYPPLCEGATAAWHTAMAMKTTTVAASPPLPPAGIVLDHQYGAPGITAGEPGSLYNDRDWQLTDDGYQLGHQQHDYYPSWEVPPYPDIHVDHAVT
ncbi:Forkhead domain protein [Geosmithia morbida]|uniref:Forkhead domain protein n=1 Tax=Geosmithia morbida TaxID=1094350 RepID=A0A9P4Z0F5_9HYPO|nr:Forkhead domain protein [Geosmithia morbida]KAF4124993.1 Forkhead domain protein [Geosmithia morbida]